MNSTPHTPGPWTVTTDSGMLFIIGNTPPLVGGCRPPAVARVVKRIANWPETHANANLIANAPALLAAAKAVVSHWESGDLAAAVRDLSAAIAMAEQQVKP